MGFAASGGFRTICFIVGAVFSSSIGFLGMWLATRGNVRTTAAATRGSFADALADGRAGAIDGVDLSAQMIEVARGKGRYRTLEVADLRAALADPAAAAAGYDLIVAADVFIYVGALDGIFPAVRAILPAGGLFAFSVEHLDGEGYVIQPSSRHAHSEDYIATLAAAAGFERLPARHAPLRTENRIDIAGRIEVLRRG